MPDWFYRTTARTILFRLPDPMARTLALGVIGTLGRSRPGRAVIEFMGHMAPEPRLAVTLDGIRLASPIGLGWRVDPERRAGAGLAKFGIGCLEVVAGSRLEVCRGDNESLCDAARSPAPDVSGSDLVPLLQRELRPDGSEVLRLPSGRRLPVLAWDTDPATVPDFSGEGVVLQWGERRDGGRWCVPAGLPAGAEARVAEWRRRLGPQAPLLVAGGVAQPAEAVRLIDAGATVLLVDAGLVFRGPGLVKRCNEALLARRSAALPVSAPENLFRRASLWAGALGVALAAGGLLTLLLAWTRVLLPYDEHYLGLSSRELQRNSPQLFAFMAHDRGTLAGTMMGLGWFYGVLAWQGIRRGVHGAKTAVSASALAGFLSFFAFFGFGYFDTLHAFVAAMLFQVTVQVLVGQEGGAPAWVALPDEEDATWRRAQWAQLLWVTHAAGLLIAGVVILTIGMTSVFVAEDLDFLCLTAEQARAMGDKLIAVVAHDRATLGGMLLASGVAMLLPVLWCHRRGAAWLWTAVAGLGVPAYGAALGMHLRTGYTDWRHLLPAVIGLGLWIGGLALGRGYLFARAEYRW